MKKELRWFYPDHFYCNNLFLERLGEKLRSEEGYRTAATSMMERFVVIVNGFQLPADQPLEITDL